MSQVNRSLQSIQSIPRPQTSVKNPMANTKQSKSSNMATTIGASGSILMAGLIGWQVYQIFFQQKLLHQPQQAAVVSSTEEENPESYYFQPESPAQLHSELTLDSLLNDEPTKIDSSLFEPEVTVNHPALINEPKEVLENTKATNVLADSAIKESVKKQSNEGIESQVVRENAAQNKNTEDKRVTPQKVDQPTADSTESAQLVQPQQATSTTFESSKKKQPEETQVASISRPKETQQARYWINMATALVQKRKTKQALELLDQAPENIENYQDILIYKAKIFLALKNFDQVVQLLHLRDDALSMELVAMAQEGQGDFEQAALSYQQLIQDHTLQPKWLLRLAVMYENLNIPLQAKQQYQAFIALNQNAELTKFAEQRLSTISSQGYQP